MVSGKNPSEAGTRAVNLDWVRDRYTRGPARLNASPDGNQSPTLLDKLPPSDALEKNGHASAGSERNLACHISLIRRSAAKRGCVSDSVAWV